MSNTCCGAGFGGKNRLDNIRIFQVPTLEKTGRYFWLGFKTAHRFGRDSQLLCYVSTRKFQANRRDVSFSQLKAKRLGLVSATDPKRTYRFSQSGFSICAFYHYSNKAKIARMGGGYTKTRCVLPQPRQNTKPFKD